MFPSEMMKNCGFTTKNDEKLCFYLSIIVKKKRGFTIKNGGCVANIIWYDFGRL